MNSQEQNIPMDAPHSMESLSDQISAKQPWHRPTVSFVPIQVTAVTKGNVNTDYSQPTPGP